MEGWKTAIKSLHWDSKNMSQHKLCDDIADRIAGFQDQVSEVEQSISGKLPLNQLKGTTYNITNLKSFVTDVINDSTSFLKSMESEGDKYIGMRSDCESFLSDMQRNLYLVNFTLKEELKRKLAGSLNESMPKSLERHDEIDKFMGRKPKTIKARINQIYRIVKKYGIDSRLYSDEHWQAVEDYYKAIESLGCEVEMKPCGDIRHIDSLESDGGYCDYAEDGMPRSKQYAVKIKYDDGMSVDGYIKCMAAGTVSDPFSKYDTCIVLWPKNNRELAMENRKMEKVYRLSESELKQLVSESVRSIVEDMSVADREKRLQNQMSWGDFKRQNSYDDFDKESDLIDKGADYQRQAVDWHKKDPEMWKRITGVRESEIKIKPENKGKFNATKKATGKSTEELTHSKNPLTRKRAIFAQNAKKWNKK